MDNKTKEKLIQVAGGDIVKGSMIGKEYLLSPVLSFIKPSVILEIGTLNGASAAMFSSYCSYVYTVDLEIRESAKKLWESYGVSDRVIGMQVRDNDEKVRLLENKEFDFAFVDGDHSKEGVSIDFACVKKAKAVLFHDYKPVGGKYQSCSNKRMPGIAEFVDSLSPAPLVFGPLCSQMALWLNPSRISESEAKMIRALLVNEA